MFARFDENRAMTLRVIKETKRYGRTDGRTYARTDNVKTVYPLQTKFAGGIIRNYIQPVTPQYIVCTIPSLLYQTRKKNPLVHKGLISLNMKKDVTKNASLMISSEKVHLVLTKCFRCLVNVPRY